MKSEKIGDLESWKPLRAEWALQLKVLDAAIQKLEDPAATLRDVVHEINAAQVIRMSPVDIMSHIRKIIARTSKLRFEEGGRSIFLDILQRQRAWLTRQPGGVAPDTFWQNQRSRIEFERQLRKTTGETDGTFVQ